MNTSQLVVGFTNVVLPALKEGLESLIRNSRIWAKVCDAFQSQGITSEMIRPVKKDGTGGNEELRNAVSDAVTASFPEEVRKLLVTPAKEFGQIPATLIAKLGVPARYSMVGKGTRAHQVETVGWSAMVQFKKTYWNQQHGSRMSYIIRQLAERESMLKDDGKGGQVVKTYGEKIIGQVETLIAMLQAVSVAPPEFDITGEVKTLMAFKSRIPTTLEKKAKA